MVGVLGDIELIFTFLHVIIISVIMLLHLLKENVIVRCILKYLEMMCHETCHFQMLQQQIPHRQFYFIRGPKLETIQMIIKKRMEKQMVV